MQERNARNERKKSKGKDPLKRVKFTFFFSFSYSYFKKSLLTKHFFFF